MKRVVAAAGIAGLLVSGAESRTFDHGSPPPHEDSVVVVWNATLLQAVRNVPAATSRHPHSLSTRRATAHSARRAPPCSGSLRAARISAAYTFPAGSSTIEPGTTPATDITLEWRTFDEAADEAGLSQRFGGIPFRQGDLESRQMGRAIGRQAWETALKYFRGSAEAMARYN